MDELAVGIAGLGYWGPNLLRNFRTVEGCRVNAVADIDPSRLTELARMYPDIRCLSSADDLVDDDALDAIVLALPPCLLPDLAVRALRRGKHVLVEKPMAHSMEAALEMVAAAAGAGTVAMVDHTFVYSPAVRYLKTLLDSGEVGTPHYYQSTRINLGRFRSDVDVVWDLGVHDVSILSYLLGRDPVSVMAMGRSRPGSPVDTAHVTLTFPDGVQGFVQVSWMAPTKVRMALVACDGGMLLYNDVEPDEKVRIYRLLEPFDPRREDPLVPTFRLGDVSIPRLAQEEPLRAVAEAFVTAALGGPPPPTDLSFGLRVLAVLDAARRSLATGEVTEVAILERQA